MTIFEEFYKLGAAQAAADFTSALDNETDNPTAAPPKMAATIAVEKFLDKYSKERAERTTRGPRGKTSKFQALLKKKRKG